MAILLEGKIFLRVLYKKFQAGYNGSRPGMGRLFWCLILPKAVFLFLKVVFAGHCKKVSIPLAYP